MKNLFTIAFLLTFTVSNIHSQITIKPMKTVSNNIQEALQNLIGDGIIIKNFTINQSEQSLAFGSYQDQRKSLGIEKGVIATTGSIMHVAGPNDMKAMTSTDEEVWEGTHLETPSGDRVPELERLLTGSNTTYDGFVLEMDIVATADTLSFNYVFGSEEYDDFVCSEYNDIFAFFISGPGIKGEKNMAVLPRTNTPVSINNVNDGNPESAECPKSNTSFYLHNTGMNIEYNGFTRLLEIRQEVKPMETYHLKLCIADVGDNGYDSGIIFENRSVVSYHEEVSVLFNTNEKKLDQLDHSLLDEVIETMKQRGVETIVISGNTDSDGSDEANFKLAKGRVESVLDYLEANGIDREKMIINVRGETMPIAANDNSKGKSVNRRVDIRLLGNNDDYWTKENEYLETVTDLGPRLDQNAPNPFSDLTVINFFVPNKSQSAELLVTNLAGQVVRRIVILERGEGSIQLNASLFERQTYLYSLIVDGNIVASKKLSVME